MSSTVQYTDMKDSGIKWIGSVPSHWHLHTLYQLATQVKNKNSDLREKNLLSLSYGKIKRKDINTNDGLLPASFDGYNIIEAGDIVLRLTDLQNDHNSLRVGQATERGIITSAYTTLRSINPAHSRYLYYLIHAFDLKKGFYGMGSGVRQGLNYDEVKELRVVLPSTEEQGAVASFLDAQCEQIDVLIEEAKLSIAEYKKWKSSIIFEAATKGIDKDATLKESKTQWLGKVPANWRTLSLKFMCEMQAGKNITANDIADTGEYPVYGGNGLRGYYTNYNQDGTYLLVGRQGALCGNVHRVSGKFWATEHAVVTTATALADLSYLYYLLIAMNLNQYALSTAAQPGLSVNVIQNVATVCPAIDEQRAIAKYLDEVCEKIDTLIGEKGSLIEDLESYKRSLIYECVTGKRKVV